MNLTILKGNIGSDPVIKTFENGGKKASFSLATSESYTNKQGEKITDTDWHNIVFDGPICDTIEKYLHKGDMVIVTGKIKYRAYDKDGQTRYVTEIKCREFEFCGKRESKSESVEDNNPF